MAVALESLLTEMKSEEWASAGAECTLAHAKIDDWYAEALVPPTQDLNDLVAAVFDEWSRFFHGCSAADQSSIESAGSRRVLIGKQVSSPRGPLPIP